MNEIIIFVCVYTCFVCVYTIYIHWWLALCFCVAVFIWETICGEETRPNVYCLHTCVVSRSTVTFILLFMFFCLSNVNILKLDTTPIKKNIIYIYSFGCVVRALHLIVFSHRRTYWIPVCNRKYLSHMDMVLLRYLSTVTLIRAERCYTYTIHICLLCLWMNTIFLFEFKCKKK